MADTDCSKLQQIMLKYEPDSIYRDEDGWNVTTGWLVGTFAGRAFVSENLEDALGQMCDYLTRHIDHESLVGNEVTKSGWPNLNAVEQYLKQTYSEDEN